MRRGFEREGRKSREEEKGRYTEGTERNGENGEEVELEESKGGRIKIESSAAPTCGEIVVSTTTPVQSHRRATQSEGSRILAVGIAIGTEEEALACASGS